MAELLEAWAPLIRSAALVPSSGGRFEVTLDGEVIFSKAALDRHARPREVYDLVEARLGPAVDRKSFS